VSSRYCPKVRFREFHPAPSGSSATRRMGPKRGSGRSLREANLCDRARPGSHPRRCAPAAPPEPPRRRELQSSLSAPGHRGGGKAGRHCHVVAIVIGHLDIAVFCRRTIAPNCRAWPRTRCANAYGTLRRRAAAAAGTAGWHAKVRHDTSGWNASWLPPFRSRWSPMDRDAAVCAAAAELRLKPTGTPVLSDT
jgi:hypothetical protein